MTLYNTLFPYLLFVIFAMFVYFGFLLKNYDVIETFENTEEKADKNTDKKTDKKTDKNTDKINDKKTDKNTDKKTYKKTDKNTDKNTDKKTEEKTPEQKSLNNKNIKNPKPITEKEYTIYNDELFDKGNRDMMNLINTCKEGMENIEKITIKFQKK